MHISNNAQDVNGARTNNSQAGIGHNSQGALERAVAENKKTAAHLFCRELLVTAIHDSRLERSHLRIIAAFAQLMVDTDLRAWPERGTLAAMTALSPKTVSNLIYELRQFGYLIAERQPVPEADDRCLMVYTFGNIDHEEIRRQIGRVTRRLMAEREAIKNQLSSPPTGNSDVPAHGELPRPRGTDFPASGELTSPPAGKKTPKTATSSPPAGCSIYNNITTLRDNNLGSSDAKPTKATKGSRLPVDWTLPKSWGEWALTNFEITRDQVLTERDAFRDHWLSATGAKATKADWQATWRNWIRNSRKCYRPKRGMSQADLPVVEVDEAAIELERARQLLGGGDA